MEKENIIGRSNSLLNPLASIGELLKDVSLGEVGFERAVQLRDELVKGLPELSSNYMYPWYCLLVALASDQLRYLQGGGYFFTYGAQGVVGVFYRAQYAEKVFRSEIPQASFGEGVGVFLGTAREAFANLCWHLIDPDKYDSFSLEDQSRLWELLEVIPEKNEHRDSCESIYYDLCSSLSAGRPDPSGILESIMSIELGDEWDGNLAG